MKLRGWWLNLLGVNCSVCITIDYYSQRYFKQVYLILRLKTKVKNFLLVFLECVEHLRVNEVSK